MRRRLAALLRRWARSLDPVSFKANTQFYGALGPDASDVLNGRV